MFNPSAKCVSMLNALPEDSEKIFDDISQGTVRRVLVIARKRLADKLKNPRLRQICYHCLGYGKGRMPCHQTQDLIRLQEFLGCRGLGSTEPRIQIEKAISRAWKGEFTLKVARSREETKQQVRVASISPFRRMDVFQEARMLGAYQTLTALVISRS
jgi:hypothetical protein